MPFEAEEKQEIKWSAIIVLILGTFMAVLDTSIVNVAIPKMMAVFGASEDKVEWILTGYMLALGVVMPVSGFLGDRFGYKRVFIAALLVFGAGSALCGMAWSVNSMIAFRVIQALGGGLMQPLSMAAIFQYAPRSKTGTLFGIWGISIMVAPAIGPTLGGYLVDYATWRLLFYINVPIAIIGFFLGAAFLEETQKIKGKSVDFLGLILSSSLFFCLMLALNKASSKGWDSPFIVGLLTVSLISLVLFVIVELRHPEPILELRLLKNYVFSLSLIITSTIGIGLFGAIFLLPIYIQNLMGYSAMVSGLITMPSAIASGLMMPIAGRMYDKYGARRVAVIGLPIIAICTYGMHNFDLTTPFAVIIGWTVVRGLGMGLTNMPISTAGMNTVPPQLMGKGSAMQNVVRQVASSFGIAMFTTIWQNRAVFHFNQLAQSVNMNSDQALAMQNGLQALAVSNGMSTSTVQSLAMSSIAQKISLMASVSGIGDCFIIAAAMGVVAFVLCLFLKEDRFAQARKAPRAVSE